MAAKVNPQKEKPAFVKISTSSTVSPVYNGQKKLTGAKQETF